MTELRELARGVMQQGVGRLRRRARGLATLVGIDVDAVRSVARRALETAQSLPLKTFNRPAKVAAPLPNGAQQTDPKEPALPSSEAPADQATASSSGGGAGGPPPSPSASSRVPSTPVVQGGFFQGPPRRRTELPDKGQLRLFARDSWTLFALWEVGPSLRPPQVPGAVLELWLRPVGGAVIERLEVPASGSRYFEGLVPARTYLAELWWRTPNGEIEPVAVVPRTATLPAGPGRADEASSEAVRFVRVDWDETPVAEGRSSGARVGADFKAQPQHRPARPRVTTVASPPGLVSHGRSGLRATARVGWAGSPDEAGRSLETATSPSGLAASSPSRPWSGSPDRAQSQHWAGSPSDASKRGASDSRSHDASSPGSGRPWGHPPVREVPRPPVMLRAAPEQRAERRDTHVPEAKIASPLPVPPRRDHRPLPAPTPTPLPRRQPRRGPRAAAHPFAPAAGPSAPSAPVNGAFFQPPAPPPEDPKAAVHAGFFVARHAPAARTRRPLAPAREGEPLASAESPKRRD